MDLLHAEVLRPVPVYSSKLLVRQRQAGSLQLFISTATKPIVALGPQHVNVLLVAVRNWIERGSVWLLINGSLSIVVKALAAFCAGVNGGSTIPMPWPDLRPAVLRNKQ